MEQDNFAEFGKYFKNYMSVAATLTAAMPLAAANVIPVYSSVQSVLAGCASLFCFLMFAYVFYIRNSLSRAMFSSGTSAQVWRLVPLVFIALAVASGLSYLAVLQRSEELAREAWAKQGVAIADTTQLLQWTDYVNIPLVFPLILLYLGFFVFAETAFVLMAAREYLENRPRP